MVKGAGRVETVFYDSVGSNPTGTPSCSELDFQNSTSESASVQIQFLQSFSI